MKQTEDKAPAVVTLDGNKPYGPQVKSVRLHMGYTVRSMCELAGFTDESNLRHWENGTGPYKTRGGTGTETLQKYLRALGVGSITITINLL